LCIAAAPHSVPGADRAVFGGLSYDRAICRRPGELPVDARPQLSLRVLCRLGAQSGGADHPIPAPRPLLQWHRGDHLRYLADGPQGMASGMARKHQSPFERTLLRALVLSLLTVGLAAAALGRAAAEAAPTASQPAPAPYSRDCQIGSTPI